MPDSLYVDPPAHAIVLSVDEKSQIQALDRTQPGLPLKPGHYGIMRHDYKRNGTTVRRPRRDRGQGHWPLHAAPPASRIYPLLNAIEAETPVGQIVHVILDNYGSH